MENCYVCSKPVEDGAVRCRAGGHQTHDICLRGVNDFCHYVSCSHKSDHPEPPYLFCGCGEEIPDNELRVIDGHIGQLARAHFESENAGGIKFFQALLHRVLTFCLFISLFF